jgi:hypothetical protein
MRVYTVTLSNGSWAEIEHFGDQKALWREIHHFSYIRDTKGRYISTNHIVALSKGKKK